MTDDTTPTVYHKHCPWLSLDLGIWPFSNVEYTPDEMNKFCGYDTEFDPTVGKCVPTTVAHCDTIDLSGLTTYEEKKSACNAQACTVGLSGTCGSMMTCMVNGDDATAEAGCKANPGCTWNPDAALRGSAKKRGLFADTTIRATCESDEMRVSELCGQGTTYNSILKVCERA